jgi:hypothetical protein
VSGGGIQKLHLDCGPLLPHEKVILSIARS